MAGDTVSGQDAAATECQSIIRDVWLFLDNELDPVRRATVEQHLIDCPPCLDETDVGHRLKTLLQRKCGGETAPAVLRQNLIAALQIEVTVSETNR